MKTFEKIAKLIIDGKLTIKEGENILANMKATDKKKLKNTITRLLEYETIHVTSKDDINLTEKKLIGKMFSGKKMIFEKNENVGSGIIVRENDTIYDASISGIVRGIIGNLRENL